MAYCTCSVNHISDVKRSDLTDVKIASSKSSKEIEL